MIYVLSCSAPIKRILVSQTKRAEAFCSEMTISKTVPNYKKVAQTHCRESTKHTRHKASVNRLRVREKWSVQLEGNEQVEQNPL